MRYRQRLTQNAICIKRALFPSFILFWIGVLGYIVFYSVHIQLPSKEVPLRFFASENGDDLQQIICRAVKSANSSLFLSSFGYNDPYLFDNLYDASLKGLSITLLTDDKHATNYPAIPNVAYQSHTAHPLMHKKILLVDDDTAYLGSVNYTSPSLIMHKNCLFGIYNPNLCHAIRHNEPFYTQTLQYYPLPQEHRRALFDVCQTLEKAEKHISLAMYLLTHPQILDCLQQAVKRGVIVDIYIDKQSLRGKLKQKIYSIGANVYVHNEMGLLHHKCALIDDRHLILGSLNWTKNGFSHNLEYLLCHKITDYKLLNDVQSMFSYLKPRCKPLQPPV